MLDRQVGVHTPTHTLTHTYTRVDCAVIVMFTVPLRICVTANDNHVPLSSSCRRQLEQTNAPQAAAALPCTWGRVGEEREEGKDGWEQIITSILESRSDLQWLVAAHPSLADSEEKAHSLFYLRTACCLIMFTCLRVYVFCIAASSVSGNDCCRLDYRSKQNTNTNAHNNILRSVWTN